MLWFKPLHSSSACVLSSTVWGWICGSVSSSSLEQASFQDCPMFRSNPFPNQLWPASLSALKRNFLAAWFYCHRVSLLGWWAPSLNFTPCIIMQARKKYNYGIFFQMFAVSQTCVVTKCKQGFTWLSFSHSLRLVKCMTCTTEHCIYAALPVF